jgi:hypothetical protein
MMNGEDLAGSTTSGQCGIIVPQPGTSKFYIFTNAPFTSSAGLCYSKVDMSENYGMGMVTMKNIQLFPYTTEKLDAIFDSVTGTYWVIAHPYESERFYAYKINSEGLDITPVISEPCAFYSGGNPFGYNAIGQMTVSPDGKTIASGVLSDGYIELCDFNISTGMISNSRIIPGFPDAWGIAFSPNSKMLYAVRWWTDSVFQYDLRDTSLQAIIQSKTLVGNATASNAYGYQAGYMQLGPDGKLYIARYEEHFLAVINNPDSLGTACGFVNDGVYLGSATSTAGLSRAPLRRSIPVGIKEFEKSPQLSFTVLPSPAKTSIEIDLNSRDDRNFTLDICDVNGKNVIQTISSCQSRLKVDISMLPKGVYLVKLNSDKGIAVNKVVIY